MSNEEAMKQAIRELDELAKDRAERLRAAGMSHCGENTKYAKRDKRRWKARG